MTTLVTKYAGLDTVADAVTAWLRGRDFTQALLDIQLARADGVELPLPAKILPVMLDNPKDINPNDFPLGMVVVGPARSNNAQNVAADFNVSVLVVWILAGDDIELLTRLVQRYLLATRLCFDRAPGFFPYLPNAPIIPGTMTPDPVVGSLAGMSQRYMKAGTYDFIVPVLSY